MLNFEVKTTHRYKAEVDDVRISIVDREGDCYIEVYWGKGYANSMYFIVASVEEAQALATKCVEFLKQNSPVLIESSDKCDDRAD
jgi:hypothetical protein